MSNQDKKYAEILEALDLYVAALSEQFAFAPSRKAPRWVTFTLRKLAMILARNGARLDSILPSGPSL